MATLFAKANHNWSARNTNNWTTDGGTTYQNPAAGDVLVTNNFTVTVDETTFVIGEIKNGATTSGGYTSTAGGKFSIGGSYTLKATTVTVGTATLVDVAAGATAPVLEADVIVGASIGTNINGVFAGYGSLTITAIGGGYSSITGCTSTVNAEATIRFNTSSTNHIVYGYVVGGSGSLGGNAINNANTSTVTINGSVSGGAGSGLGYGVTNTVNGVVIINGNCSGGSAGGACVGSYNNGTGTITINGNAIGGNSAAFAHGAYNNSTGTITVNGAAIGNDCGPGSPYSTYAANNGLYNNTRNTNCSVKAVISGKYGVNGIGGYGAIINEDTSVHSNNYVRWYKADESYVHFEDPDLNGDYPAEADTRLNTSYAGGSRTGSLAVPNPASVAYGTPTDNTVGTAVLTAENVAAAVWDVLRSGHTTGSTFGEWGYPGMLSRSYPRGV